MNSNLNDRLAAIGFRLAATQSRRRRSAPGPDMERVLLEATERARADGRLMSMLFSWTQVHAEHVIVEKLRKLLRNSASEEQQLVGSALAAYALHIGKHKWRKIIDAPAAPRPLSVSGNVQSAIELKGVIPWLEQHNILAPEGSLRIRQADVLDVEELAARNLQYRNRLLFGACWRADIITAIQNGAATATEVMKRVGCSYEPAHRIRKEYLIASKR